MGADALPYQQYTHRCQQPSRQPLFSNNDAGRDGNTNLDANAQQYRHPGSQPNAIEDANRHPNTLQHTHGYQYAHQLTLADPGSRFLHARHPGRRIADPANAYSVASTHF